MSVLTRLVRSPWPLWVLLALPGAWWTAGWWRGTTFYGEYLHATGDLSARLFLATLAITPLWLLFPRAAWARWLVPRRRHLGVAAFGYALLHTGAYLGRQPWAAIAEDAATAAIWTGWVAFAIMLPLALTSTDAAVRTLRRAWKPLHRLAYLAAVLTFVHWILTAFDPGQGYVHLGILGAILLLRVVLTAWRRTRRRAGRPVAP